MLRADVRAVVVVDVGHHVLFAQNPVPVPVDQRRPSVAARLEPVLVRGHRQELDFSWRERQPLRKVAFVEHQRRERSLRINGQVEAVPGTYDVRVTHDAVIDRAIVRLERVVDQAELVPELVRHHVVDGGAQMELAVHTTTRRPTKPGSPSAPQNIEWTAPMWSARGITFVESFDDIVKIGVRVGGR